MSETIASEYSTTQLHSLIYREGTAFIEGECQDGR